MNRRKPISILYHVALALALAACGSAGGNTVQPRATPTSPPVSEERLSGTRWVLVSLGEPEEETPAIKGSNVVLEFKDKGQVSGSGGCNSYGGQYQVEGNRIAFREIVSTLMACAEQAITNQETQYLQALGATSRFNLSDNRLSIYYDNDKSVLNFIDMPDLSATPSPTAPTHSSNISDAGLIPSGPDEKRYALTAEVGQTITIEINSDGAPLSLTITSPGGAQQFPEVQQTGSSFQISHTVRASETGDYQLTLTKADHTPSTNYTAIFVVQ